MSVETIGDIRRSKVMQRVRRQVMATLLTDPRTQTEHEGHFPGQELLPDDARIQKVLTTEAADGSATSITIGSKLGSSYHRVPPGLWVIYKTPDWEGSSVFTFAGNDMRGHIFPKGTSETEGSAEFYDFGLEDGIEAARKELERILAEIEASKYTTA